MEGLLFISALIVCNNALAEVVVESQPRDNFAAGVSVEISIDPNTHLYTYSYTISNQPGSAQSIDVFAFDIDETTPIIEANAPEGWSSGRYVYRNTYEFASTEGISEANRVQLPSGGYEIRSPHDIVPGETVCCFVFKTFSAPKQGNAYLQGYVPLPQSTGEEEYEPDFSESHPSPDDLENNSIKVTTSIPATPLYDGNRRPSVDGFVAPISVYTANKDEFYAPVTLYLAFALNGEEVFTSTFKATLNGIDVTDKVRLWCSGRGERRSQCNLRLDRRFATGSRQQQADSFGRGLGARK